MKAIALAQRLIRDLQVSDLAGMSASDRLELVDCINLSLAVLHGHAPPSSKITRASITLAAPRVVTLYLTNGCTEFPGFAPDPDDLYCTVRIEGDPIDNQIGENGELVFPYSGATGNVSATIYHDASLIPEEVEEIVDDPIDIDTGERLIQDAVQSFRAFSETMVRKRQIGRPTRWWMDENASTKGTLAPGIFRVDRLPDKMHRLSVRVSQSPGRVSFILLLNGDAHVPCREAFIEPYLLPIARAKLADSSLWRNDADRDKARRQGEAAEARFIAQVPRQLATPANRVFTPTGY